MEGLVLGVQLAIGLGSRDHHPGEQIAALGDRIGGLVVEFLADVERLGQRRACGLDRGGEGRRLGGSELLDGQRQLVGTGAHRVVHLDHDRAGQLVEGVDGHRGQGGGVGGVDGACGCDVGFVPLSPPPATPEHHPGDKEQADAGEDQQARHRSASAAGAVPGRGDPTRADAGQSGGGRGRRSGPVALA